MRSRSACLRLVGTPGAVTSSFDKAEALSVWSEVKRSDAGPVHTRRTGRRARQYPAAVVRGQPGGDHTVLLARVTEAEPGEDSLRPLTWYQRFFGAHTSQAQ